jgi:hypothetical protein
MTRDEMVTEFAHLTRDEMVTSHHNLNFSTSSEGVPKDKMNKMPVNRLIQNGDTEKREAILSL